MSEWERFKATVEEQQRAEADGGYAAGDAPYYNSDTLAALVRIAKAAKEHDCDRATTPSLREALTALETLGEKE